MANANPYLSPVRAARAAYAELRLRLGEDLILNRPILSQEELDAVALLENSPLARQFHLGIIVADYAAQRYLFASSGIQPIIGYTPTQLLQLPLTTVAERIHPDDLQKLTPCIPQVLHLLTTLSPTELRSCSYTYTFRFAKPDGNFVPILQQTLPLRLTPQGTLHRDLATLYDLSLTPVQQVPSALLRYTSDDGHVHSINLLDAADAFSSDLSPRERDVLALILQGYTTLQIALRLGLSHHTINTHRKNILQKTGAANAAELVRLAIANGWA